jgi:hypothetical protein
MSRYLVTFFKNLLSSDGHSFKCPQESIEIRRAKSVDRAVEAAARRYERRCRLPDWTVHADGLELEVDGKKVDYHYVQVSHHKRRSPAAGAPKLRLND